MRIETLQHLEERGRILGLCSDGSASVNLAERKTDLR